MSEKLQYAKYNKTALWISYNLMSTMPYCDLQDPNNMSTTITCSIRH